jgi:hypothetical protein
MKDTSVNSGPITNMKRIRYAVTCALASALFGLVGCATNPLMTGEPDDWVGHTTTELRAGLGEPNRVVPQADGKEVWEYVSTGTYVRENRSPGTYENLSRYGIKNGIIKSWFFERAEDGRVVEKDH